MPHLPACFPWKPSYGHPVHGSTGARGHAGLIELAITRTIATTRKLNDKALAHEFGSI